MARLAYRAVGPARAGYRVVGGQPVGGDAAGGLLQQWAGLGEAAPLVRLDVGEGVGGGDAGGAAVCCAGSVLRPATATTGTPAAAAAAATPAGALPCSVCSSSEPSPVMTSLAPGRWAANETSSSIRLDARPGPGAQEGERGETQAAGRARPRLVRPAPGRPPAGWPCPAAASPGG